MLLVSSLGLTVNMHFCQDHLYDIALNRPAHSCCEEGAPAAHCHHDQMAMDSHHCDNESVRIRSTDDYVVSGFSIDFSDLHSIDLFLSQPVAEIIPESRAPEYSSFTHYNRPPPQAVVLSRIQSFLI
jgi:hypothetical protein